VFFPHKADTGGRRGASAPRAEKAILPGGGRNSKGPWARVSKTIVAKRSCSNGGVWPKKELLKNGGGTQ